MGVDFDIFMDWAKDRFGDDAIKVKYTSHGAEILTHSFYAHKKGIEDYTFNLWMSPSGGKSQHPEKGSFRCWKTDTMGSLVRLVSDFDHIPPEEAEELICAGGSLRELEIRVHEFFGTKEPDAPAPVEVVADRLVLPDWTFLIDGMSPTNPARLRAKNYLAARKLPTEGLHVCTGGDYKDRIVIPYFDREGNLIWYNARTMSEKKGVIKYMKCKSDGLAVTQEDVLYMTSWPEPGGKVYVMEGEFDSKSVALAGLVGCGLGGKSISDTQIQTLRGYQIVLAFDADEGVKKDSGLQALIGVGQKLLQEGITGVRYVRPPKVYKDWNKLLVERDATVLRGYIDKFEKPFTASTPDVLLARNL
jgi:hypothetical protein